MFTTRKAKEGLPPPTPSLQTLNLNVWFDVEENEKFAGWIPLVPDKRGLFFILN